MTSPSDASAHLSPSAESAAPSGGYTAPILIEPYGWFDPEAKEFVIGRPDTPRPWRNLLTNGSLSAEVSHLGGGMIWSEAQPRRSLLTGGESESSLQREPGWAIYLRDRTTGGCWSPLPRPACGQLEAFECHHGLGRTTWKTRIPGLMVETTTFLPSGRDAQVWMISLTSTAATPTIWDITFAAFLDPSPDSFVEVRYDPEGRLLTAHTRESSLGGHPGLFLATSHAPVGFDGMTEFFLGRGGDTSAPATALAGTSNNFENAIGPASMIVRLETPISAGATVRFDAAVGASFGGSDKLLETARALAADLRAGGKTDQWLEGVTRWVADQLSASQVEVPSATLDVAFNSWTPWQTRVAVRRRRILPPEERWQTMGAVLGLDAATAIDTLARATDDDRRQARLRPATVTTSLPWALDALMMHVAELGAEPLREPATELLTMLAERVDALGGRLTERGLVPSAGGGDEVVLSAQLVWGARRGAAAAEALGRGDVQASLHHFADQVRNAINQHAWNGAWYRDRWDPSATAHREPSETTQQRFVLDAQTWAILAEVADAKRGAALLKAAVARLGSPIGLRGLSPSYRMARAGDVASLAPVGGGATGGVDLRSAAWLAWTLLQGVAPLEHQPSPDAFCLEPYAWPTWLEGAESQLPGRAHGSWVTTTAVWMQRAFLESLLGIRAEVEGIRVDPVLPAGWREVVVRRRFRDVVHQFFIHNPRGETHGLRSLVADGKRVSGALVPPPTSRTAREIEVSL
jgi:cellobiose phosphorylase